MKDKRGDIHSKVVFVVLKLKKINLYEAYISHKVDLWRETCVCPWYLFSSLMPTVLHICQTEGTEGMFWGVEQVWAIMGVTMVQDCYSFAFSIVVVVHSSASSWKSARWILSCASLDPLQIYCPFPKIHVSIGNHLFIRQGKNKREIIRSD